MLLVFDDDDDDVKDVTHSQKNCQNKFFACLHVKRGVKIMTYVPIMQWSVVKSSINLMDEKVVQGVGVSDGLMDGISDSDILLKCPDSSFFPVRRIS